MIIAGSKFTGKKLVNVIIRELRQQDRVSLAAVSDRGVNQINSAGQKAANVLGYKISATPSEGEVAIDGIHRVALIVTLEKKVDE